MSFNKPTLRLVLDEGVPDAVGHAFVAAGHLVIFCNKTLARGASDDIVCAFAEINAAILVALDGDMKQIAKGYGLSNSRFKNLSLIKLSCRETRAAQRVREAMSLIEHEWHVAAQSKRRIFIEIQDTVIRTCR